MLDFLMVTTRVGKKNEYVEVYPKFIIRNSKDLMIRGGDFYSIWDDANGRWSVDEQDAVRLIDEELDAFKKEHQDSFEAPCRVAHLWDSDTGSIDRWHKYCQKQMRDCYHQLDEKLIFSNTETNKTDYSSKHLNYPLEQTPIDAYDKLMSTLYSPEERQKIEWAIGSIVNGDSKTIQKFVVLYGAAGTGKSTVLNIIQLLFEGYFSVFDARALGSASNSFALEAFKSNPLVAIQHDGDLSKIEDNTRLNSLVSHELMTVNEKFKSTYTNRFNAFLFMGTNKPVRITDAKSGLIRRLIDVQPSGNKVPGREYKKLVGQIPFELGGIALHCLEVYESNQSLYDSYIPLAMMGASNDFYNFMEDSYFTFLNSDGVSLKAAWEMYKVYCEEAKVAYPYSQRLFKEELKTYFNDYKERITLDDGTRLRSYFSGFKKEKFEAPKSENPDETKLIEFDDTNSIFDTQYADCPAQYTNEDGTPLKKWDSVKTTLKDLDTTKLHYVRVPENHIVIDFDIKDKTGKKNSQANILAASKWPTTYAELSKSGQGVHLHYIYKGDVSKLSRVYDDEIEVKVFTGKSSLRRMRTKCSNMPIATISSGLPLKEDKKMVNAGAVKSERALRIQIKKNLNKEYHANTKPSVDFIKKILDDAYESGLHYDVSDMRSDIFAFAMKSTHQADYCVKLVGQMKFKSEETAETKAADDRIVFYDVEIFPNLFLVNWKYAGEGHQVVRMINPTPLDIEGLVKYKLIGFNCRRYDNHMLYARMLGYTNEQLYQLSQRLISKGDRSAFFGEAYNLSYTDVYDFCSKKQSLKKWEIELDIHHQELGLPWDEPVPEEMWQKVAEYCDNDVLATEAVFNARHADFVAREILANIAGMTLNDTTNSLTTRIIFGKERHPQLVYTDLATGEQEPKELGNPEYKNKFSGYEFYYDAEAKQWKNMYRGIDLGKGGYVDSIPGMYSNVALLDVESLHPHSAIALNYFGTYTQNFADLVQARVYIKHGDYEDAKKLFNGALAPYLDDPDMAKALAYALKIAINSVYGLTSANFDNPFRDIRNKNNIVALRGALFMKTLQDEVTKKGFKVIHVKTDSLKIVEANQEIIDFCMEFAKEYGYKFEHEATYEKICLVNDSTYIAKYSQDDVNGDHKGQWTATAAQFQVPYVFKTLFSHEPIEFKDFCETKSVTSALYLDMNEGLTTTPEVDKELEWRRKNNAKASEDDGYIVWKNPTFKNETTETLEAWAAKSHNYQFIGKVGQFCPIKPGCGGGELVRDNKGRMAAATGSKGYRWLESEQVKTLHKEDCIDKSYYTKLVNEAVHDISQYGDFEWFVS